MRKLTARQKKLLDECVKRKIDFSEDIPEAEYKKIVSLNDYETIHWDIDRYLNDNRITTW